MGHRVEMREVGLGEGSWQETPTSSTAAIGCNSSWRGKDSHTRRARRGERDALAVAGLACQDAA